MRMLSSLYRISHRISSVKFRSYSDNAKPVQMAYDVFEGSQTDKSKPPLIIMHGLFGSKQNWRSVGRALKDKTNRKIITVDARNHGKSPHTKEHSSLHMSLDVISLMKQFGVQKSTVMGHSMGGRTMMFLALKYPEFVNDGIIVDISPIELPRDFHQMEEIFLAMKNVKIPDYLSMGDGRKFAEMEMKKVVHQKETIDFILLNLRKKKNGSFSWAVNVESLHNNIRLFDSFSAQIKGLPPFKGKMMFICGNKSDFVDPNTWPQIQEYFPNSEIHWLDAGHLVHFQQPAKFVKLLVHFLGKQ